MTKRKVLLTRTLAAAMQMYVRILRYNVFDTKMRLTSSQTSPNRQKAKQQKCIFSQSFSALHIPPWCRSHTKKHAGIFRSTESFTRRWVAEEKCFDRNMKWYMHRSNSSVEGGKKNCAEKSILFCVVLWITQGIVPGMDRAWIECAHRSLCIFNKSSEWTQKQPALRSSTASFNVHGRCSIRREPNRIT